MDNTPHSDLKDDLLRLLDLIADNLTYQSTDLRVLWANRGAAEGLGKDVDELIGQYCYSLWHARKEPCRICPVQRAMRSGKIEMEEVRTPDGRVWELRAVPVYDDKGQLKGCLEVGRDITDKARAYEQLRELNENLESEVLKRTEELQRVVNAMAGREVRIAELKRIIRLLKEQIRAAGLTPVVDDPLEEPE